MFSDLAGIRDAVEARLKPQLPESWRWVPYSDTLTTAATPTVYVEFTGFIGEVDGSPLGRGQVGAELDLIITDPLTDTEKAEDAVDQHALALIFTIDMTHDLFWSKGAKRRLENGQMAWVISLVALCETPAPTEGD